MWPRLLLNEAFSFTVVSVAVISTRSAVRRAVVVIRLVVLVVTGRRNGWLLVGWNVIIAIRGQKGRVERGVVVGGACAATIHVVTRCVVRGVFRFPRTRWVVWGGVDRLVFCGRW